ncbi:MAG: hypothetical protein HON90_18220 [Halobacteriovoraceae bacterium]|jgi:hypothetical protein|nr:hypothetical protein [Halobacteriovoraceae bacterium]
MKYRQLKESLKASSALVRREIILDSMTSVFAAGQNCSQCQGYCCTFEYNSMQVTPIEAFDCYDYLVENKLLTDQLERTIEDCVKHYRLDQAIYLNHGRELRKNYTCPFYVPSAKGCRISPSSKPYGCLAFNPLMKAVNKPGNCSSNQNLLLNRDSQHQEEVDLNNQVKGQLKLYWSKKNLPMAILEMINLFK